MKQHIFLIFFILFVSSCSSNKITEDIETRVDILYEHTVLMDQYSTNEELLGFGLDMSKLSNNEDLTTVDMMDEMESSYSIELDGTYEAQVQKLEDKMTLIMDEWAKLEEIKQNILIYEQLFK
jgi:hypothetical protein